MRIVFMLIALCASTNVIADVYKFTDNYGRVFYTDERKNSAYKRIIKSKPIQSPIYSNTLNSALKFNSYTGVNKKRFTDIIDQAAYKHQIDAKLVHAVIQTESAYNSTAQSSKGAVGLMQLMPETAKRFGVINRNDPDQNVDGGTRYLKHLIKLFNPKLELAIAAYNAGENAVINHNNSIPPYPETQNYVRQVLALYHR